MNPYVVIFCIVATIFAIATLIYVVGSIIKQLKKKKVRKPRVVHTEEASSPPSCGWLLLGCALGAASGAVTACVVARCGKTARRISKKQVERI